MHASRCHLCTLDYVTRAGLKVVAIACGGFHSLCVVRGGSIYAWGRNGMAIVLALQRLVLLSLTSVGFRLER